MVAPWFFVIAGLWGIAVEALARFAGPLLTTTYPLAEKLAGGPRRPGIDSPAPLGAGGRRRLTTTLAGASALVVLAVVVGGGISLLGSTVFGPTATVSRYLDQVSSGNLVEADKTVRLTAQDGKRVVSNKVLGPGDRITDARVDKVTVNGDHALVAVSYLLGGARHAAQLELTSSGTQLLVFPEWHLTTPLRSMISVAVDGGKAVAVNGVTVPIADGYGVLDVYPGRYVVALPGSNKWLKAPKKTVYAANAPVTAQLDVAPTAALQSEVERQTKALIDSCAAQAVAAPTGCPFQEYTYGTVSGFHWTVKSYPDVKLSPDGTTFDLSGGQITADYTESAFGFTDAQSDDAFVFGFGKVVISGDKVTLDFSD